MMVTDPDGTVIQIEQRNPATAQLLPHPLAVEETRQ